jgi:hypothetical protein
MYIDRPFTMNLPLSSAIPVAVTDGLAVAVDGIIVGIAVDGIAVAVGGIGVALGAGETAGEQALTARVSNNTEMSSFLWFIFFSSIDSFS